MAGTHVIGRQLLEVELSGSESDGFSLQRRLPEVARDWLNPVIESVLDRLVPEGEHWLIDRVQVDAGTLAPGNLEQGLADAVSRALEQHLRARMPRGEGVATPTKPASSDVNRRSAAESLAAALVHFLCTGLLPWWFVLPPGKSLETLLREVLIGEEGAAPPMARAQLTHALIDVLRSTRPRRRLVRQFAPELLSKLLEALSPARWVAVQELLETTVEVRALAGWPDFVECLWERAFAAVAHGESPGAARLIVEVRETLKRDARPVSAALEQWVERRWPNPDARHPVGAQAKTGVDTKTVANRDVEDESDTDLALEEGVFVACAGVVLLHPFLPRFFEAVGVARDGELLCPERALALLHFLATGLGHAPEHDLLLAKLLCNVPRGLPVQSRIELTRAEHEEAAALLGAVIGHWEALGETSIEGLRGSFLVRPGKLSRRGDEDVLQVEGNSFDILLDRLPWGIGVIQLPWMTRKLWVEWRF